VHTDVVTDVKLTASPEDAVALSANEDVPQGLLPSAPKVMVCGTPPIEIANVCVALGSTPFAAVNIPAKVPMALGVPLMRPDVPLSAKPGGKAFEVTKKVGAGVPFAISVNV
jgi:hypothetical protein